MLSCRNLWLLMLFGSVMHQSLAKPFNESSPLDLITQDVIHDKIEMDVKKVIRINPLDRPALPALPDEAAASTVDSSLYKIQTLKPSKALQRNYINVQRHSQPFKSVTVDSEYSGVTVSRAFTLLPSPDKTSKAKHQPKKKNLHFLYNQTDLAGHTQSKSLPVHVAAGAYPVYYVLAKTNGRFGKYPLKSFGSPQEFGKYLQRNKIEDKTDRRYAEETV